MTGWLSLSDEQRRITLEQAAVRSGITAKAIEKDWWVTLSLKALFSTEYAKYCIFKGGTSLSKGWKLIERFSEDIDIALDPEAFGMKYEKVPSHSYVKKLKREGCAFTSTKMKEALEKAFTRLGIPDKTIGIVPEPVAEKIPDKDPQTIFIHYTSLFDPHPYLADEVKMEFGVRSLREPFASIEIRSLLSEFFPNPAYAETPFEVIAVEPRKTVLEKAFLLHEKFTYRYPDSIADDRQSRHLYDLVQLMDTSAGQQALDDHDLYQLLVEHRRNYVRLSGVDYDSLQPGQLNFVPSIELHAFFESDYASMQQAMIYGQSHDFAELIRRLKLYNGRFTLMGTGLVLEELIAAALEQNRDIVEDTTENILKLPTKVTDPNGNIVNYEITMLRYKPMLFEKIKLV